jgi:Retroviral aspartyl protease
MDGIPFLVSTMVNGECFAKTLLDSGCLSYGLVSERFATRNNLQRINIPFRSLIGFNAPTSDSIHQVAVLSIDIDGHREEQAFCYIVPRIVSYDMILGMPWMKKQDVRLNAPQSICKIRSSNTIIRNQARMPDKPLECYAVSAAAFSTIVRRQRQQKK